MFSFQYTHSGKAISQEREEGEEEGKEEGESKGGEGLLLFSRGRVSPNRV